MECWWIFLILSSFDAKCTLYSVPLCSIYEKCTLKIYSVPNLLSFTHIHSYFFSTFHAGRTTVHVFRVSVEVTVVLDHYAAMETRTFVKMVVLASKCIQKFSKILDNTFEFCLISRDSVPYSNKDFNKRYFPLIKFTCIIFARTYSPKNNTINIS